jgi:hypothetical protein
MRFRNHADLPHLFRGPPTFLKNNGWMLDGYIATVLKTKILPRRILPPSKNSYQSRTKTNACEKKPATD